ncbi:dCTP deaminase [Staphylococcus canis]|uniref:dCTP deaminase, dUMP-forming n=1 Tax=Staphylococcus canis TaxID=2724942 RepID=A0ABS0T6U9_9STAP|nr:dCTP deaminase [Staphylococcus canis]MBI5974471.1 dCTP deaminase [Staphylococcus canis]
MILSDSDIFQFIEQGTLKISPFEKAHVEPASIDLTLGQHYLKPQAPQNGVQKLSEPITYEDIEADRVVIPAHAFILATTEEYLTLPRDLTGFIEGRSSVGRAGLFIQNAGWVDPGFKGKITLELYNANDFPLEVQQGQRICQIVLAMTKTAPTVMYQGKYQGQNKTTGSRFFRDWMKDGGY